MAKRLDIEARLLARYFPAFHIQFPDDPEKAAVVGTTRTNRGNDYALWIPLEDFPDSAPSLFVVWPKRLRDHGRRLLSKRGTSGDMHLLGPDRHGHLQICHCNDSYWTPNETLYKIVMKGRLWLEAYEAHLESGEDIDVYLKHVGR